MNEDKIIACIYESWWWNDVYESKTTILGLYDSEENFEKYAKPVFNEYRERRIKEMIWEYEDYKCVLLREEFPMNSTRRLRTRGK